MHTLNNHVIDLLDTELGFAIKEAQAMAAQLDAEHFDPLNDAIKQIRGVCIVAGLDGLRQLADEMVLSIEAALANEVDKEALTGLLVSSLDTAGKLASAIVVAKKENACILLPEMTAFRRLRGKPPLYEYHCLTNVSWPPFDKEVASNPLAGEQRDDVKRLLHLYQFGLLDIIRDNNRKKAFVILYRVAQRLQNIALLVMEKDYWWVIGLVLRAFAEGRLDLQVERVRLLAAVEKQLRLLAEENPGEGRNPYPEGLWRAFVSLVALFEASDDEERERRTRAAIPELDFSEQDISTIRESLYDRSDEDSQQTFQTLTELLQDARSLLDGSQEENREGARTIAADLHLVFESVASLWEQAGFRGLSRCFAQHSTRLQSNRPDSELPPEIIADFIDTILQAECALVEFNHAPATRTEAEMWENRPLTEILQDSLLKTAQLAVMGESEIHLSEIKELLGDVSSGYSGEEVLPELESAFQVVTGSARIIGLDRLADMTAKCLVFAKELLFSSESERLVDNYWEVFADSIACLEYYISNCKSGHQEDEAPLDTASECLHSLGV